MARIVIIEDELEQRDYIVDCARSINPDLEILTSDSVRGSLDIIKGHLISAFFIDIQLLDGSGIQLAKMIREIEGYKFTPIVFITGVPTKEMEAFHEVHCYDYILKPFTCEDIALVMENILLTYIQNEKKPFKELDYLPICMSGIDYRISVRDILYVECRNRKIVIVTKQEEIKYRYLSLKKFSKELPDNFIQSHQSFYVNKDNIKRINKTGKKIELYDSEEQIPIGYKYMENLKSGVIG